MSLAAVDYRWSLQPQVIASLVLLAGVYWWRMRDLRRAGNFEPRDWARVAAFAGGLVVLFIALCSPIERSASSRSTWCSTCCWPIWRRSSCCSG